MTMIISFFSPRLIGNRLHANQYVKTSKCVLKNYIKTRKYKKLIIQIRVIMNTFLVKKKKASAETLKKKCSLTSEPYLFILKLILQ